MKNQPRTQADRTASTRKALVDAARALFAEHGYGDVGTEAVVAAAGASRGALYHHFADKIDLFAAVFEAVEADALARIAAAMNAASITDPVELLRIGAATWLDVCAEPEIRRIVLVEAPAVLGWERWREISTRYGIGMTQRLLSEAMAAGRVPQQPVEPLAHILLGALREAALFLAAHRQEPNARREIGAVIDALIRSLCATEP
jgi:AcrR family transcriptional regulator